MGATLDQARSPDDATTSIPPSHINAAPEALGPSSQPVTGPTSNTGTELNTATASSPTTNLDPPMHPSGGATAVAVAASAEAGDTRGASPPPSPALSRTPSQVSPPRSLPGSPPPSPVASRVPSPSGTPLLAPVQSPTRRAASLSSIGTPRSTASEDQVDGGINFGSAPTSNSASAVVPPSNANSKKRKAVPSMDTPPVKCPHVKATSQSLRDVNPWFVKAISMLDDAALGERWALLVVAWIAFEEKHECRPNGTLSARGRPTAVADWIQRARSITWRPIIKDSRAYGKEHLAWWESLQPEWRLLDGVGDETDFAQLEDGDLQALEKPGVNGLLSVVASLFFWGTAVKAAGKKSKRWDEAVDDLLYVFTRLSS